MSPFKLFAPALPKVDQVTEAHTQEFWQEHPCGETPDVRLMGGDSTEFERFFDQYDRHRYREYPQIIRVLDHLRWKGRRVLEIGLGEGADSEQIVRRGALWSGLDFAQESVRRVRKRLELRGLPYEGLKRGSALDIPYPSQSFDMVFSHGVLHHIPDIDRAQGEIGRVLKPTGELIVMLYAKWSLNYLLSIGVMRRLGLITLYYGGVKVGRKSAGHLENAKRRGLWNYLRLKNFVHSNTDGPENPYSKVYDLREVRRVFTWFQVARAYKLFLHAPPLPDRLLHAIPGESLLGWYLWVHLHPRS